MPTWRGSSRRRFPRVVVCGLAIGALAAGSGLLARDGWLALKAALAERWIARAYEAHLRDGDTHRPWPWADLQPVARLTVERLAVRRFVLSGSTGGSLAFGVGHVDGTASPGRPGNCALAGHRDGAFAFLERLRVGDRVRLETRRVARDYAVRAVGVVHENETGILDPAAGDRLTLITCWPFDGRPGGRLRYVVFCEPAGEA